MALLELQKVSVNFGGLQAAADVDLKVHEGEIVGLIGPNGAGKTTTFNCVSGLQAPTSGRVLWKDADITSEPPHVRARLGIGRTFQRVQVFGTLSVIDNVVVGAEGAEGSLGLVGSIFRGPGERRRERFLRRRATAALETVGLAGLASRKASSLPFGLAKRMELARALAGGPQLLLLDEPASGLDQSESAEFATLLGTIREDLGISILIVEHDVTLVAEVSDHIDVLDFGRLIASGSPEQVLNAPEVVASYLGQEAAS